MTIEKIEKCVDNMSNVWYSIIAQRVKDNKILEDLKMNKREYWNNNGNHGIIETTKCYPYSGARTKSLCYRVWIYNSVGFLYHVSCYETLGDAKNDLNNCGFEI